MDNGDKQVPQMGDNKQPPLVIDEDGEAEMVDVASRIEDACSKMILESIRQEGNT